MEQSSILSAKFDCPVARQYVSLLAAAHDCEIQFHPLYFSTHASSLTRAKMSQKSRPNALGQKGSQVNANLQNYNLHTDLRRVAKRIQKSTQVYVSRKKNDLRLSCVGLRWVVKR